MVVQLECSTQKVFDELPIYVSVGTPCLEAASGLSYLCHIAEPRQEPKLVASGKDF